ncbi:MAG: methylated-DNA--[protein]-cysteine S-methyltransferase [Pseudomonadales bacterium]|nr:methylated-DNA--[protein]-cysteine S-methyltransferase [Pseudomonadales bacterium]
MELLEIDSPIGKLTLEATEQGLREIRFGGSNESETTRDHMSACSAAAGFHLREARRQLAEYFDGTRRTFTLDLDSEAASDWSELVFGRLSEVKFGETTTYGRLAAGEDGQLATNRARPVGTVIRTNSLPIIPPCHRVVAKDGSLTGYAGGLEAKRWLLEMEREHA